MTHFTRSAVREKLSSVPFFVGGSLALDRRTSSMASWTPARRARFLAAKTRAIGELARRHPALMPIGPQRMVQVRCLFDLGSLQSCICDVHDELVAPGVIASPRPTVVDVGANIGQFSSGIKAFWPDADILAIEADPDIHSVLADNAARLGGMRTLGVAVGSQVGVERFHRHHLSAMSTFRPSSVETWVEAATVDVPVRPLDDLTADLTHIDLVKIDVEGYELEVLRGARETLAKADLLLIELGLGRHMSDTNLDVLSEIRASCPKARILRTGRPLGSPSDPICQDVLIKLGA